MTVLRRLDLERDGPALHAIFGDEESCRYLFDPAFSCVEETIARLKDWTAGTEDTSWAIVGSPDGEALGRISLFHPAGDPGVWEIGIMLVPAARGRGIAAQAVKEVVTIGFNEKRARRIFADIDPDNLASLKLFQSLGFQFEGRLRATFHSHIGVRDALIYSLIASDNWPS